VKKFLSLLDPRHLSWGPALRESWGLFVFAAFFAVLFNAFYPYGIALKVEAPKSHHLQEFLKSIKAPAYPGWKKAASTPSRTPPQADDLSLDQMPRINLVGAKNRFDLKSAVFLDARSPDEYKEGHIPGALNYYADDLDQFAPLVLPQLKDKNQELVAYCHGSSCELSLVLARALINLGYTNVKVFFGGWPEWKKAGYPIQAGDQP